VSTVPVDLVVNCYERTYRDVLAPGFFSGLEGQNAVSFEGRVALVNNVADRDDARRRAEALLEAGEITALHFVEEWIDAALRVVGLAPADLGRGRRYSEHLLVAVTLPGAPWVLHWDAEVRLRERVDWTTPSIDLMEREPRVLVANPNDWHHPAGRVERTLERRNGFALGFGFSDQLFLARRADLARPIYGERCIATARNPLAHFAYIFEMRIDAYMRHHGLLRASHLDSAYLHPPESAGGSYPDATWRERLRRTWNMALLAYIERAPRALRPRCTRDLGRSS
jgi:hypothetical protein